MHKSYFGSYTIKFFDYKVDTWKGTIFLQTIVSKVTCIIKHVRNIYYFNSMCFLQAMTVPGFLLDGFESPQINKYVEIVLCVRARIDIK
jgi:hypothetical protein